MYLSNLTSSYSFFNEIKNSISDDDVLFGGYNYYYGGGNYYYGGSADFDNFPEITVGNPNFSNYKQYTESEIAAILNPPPKPEIAVQQKSSWLDGVRRCLRKTADGIGKIKGLIDP